MEANFHKAFAKQLGKYPDKIQAAFQNRLTLFLTDPFNPILSNHALTGRFEGCRSINISGDLRAVFELIGQDTALFVAFGTHSQLYG
jgi:addiction module RelE/StbE family toxin